MASNITLDKALLSRFCRKWRITELHLFGSVLRADFKPESDVDMLATFDPGAEWSLWDHVRMTEELEAIVGRKVDLLTKRSVERSDNPILRKAILDSVEQVYASG